MRDFKGSKYEATKGIYDTAVIAKMFRADVKEAKAKGELPKALKLSVRTSKYSGGSSIRVEIKAVPEGFRIANPERVMADRENPHKFNPDPLYTEEALALQKTLQGMLDAYNYDNSDPMTDYFHVRFYAFVEWDHDLYDADAAKVTEADVKAQRKAQWEKQEAERKEWEAQKAKEEAEEAARPKMKWELDQEKPDPVPPAQGLMIWFGWSECTHVDCKEPFPSFAAANAHLKEAERKQRAELDAAGVEWLGYYKTDFTVALDGDTYSGRYDIGCDEPTLEEHILAFCDPARNPFLQRSKNPESVAETVAWGQRIREHLAAGVVRVKVPRVFLPGGVGVGVN